MFKRAVEKKFRYLTPSRVKKFPPIEKPHTPEAIRKLLQPIENLEVSSEGSVSEISDVFEEYHKDSYLSKKGNGEKPISKREADWLTLEKFSDLYKDIVRKIKKEEKLKASKEVTISDDILDHHKPKPSSLEIEEKIKKILRDEEYLHDPLEKLEIRPKMESDKSSEASYDALSGIWRQLMTECAGKDFVISHPNFNVYRQDERHWLEQQSLSYETMDASIKKCQEWLDREYTED